MFRNAVSVLFLLTLAGPATPHAAAADNCKPIFDALIKVATTPNHSYTTNSSMNGGKMTEGETIFANGQKYIRTGGKWIHIPVTSQDVLEQEKEKQEHGKSACRFLRSEPVNGESGMLYSVHREYEGINEDGQMWVSSGSGLLLRVDEDFENSGNHAKEHRATRFEYGNIRPPI